MSRKSLFLLTVSALSCTLLSSQELLFFYSQGSAIGTTPYVQISADGKDIGTISVDEYASSFSMEPAYHNISLGRRGLQGVEFRIEPNGKEIRVFQIRLSEARWSVNEKKQGEIPSGIWALCEELLSEEKESIVVEEKTRDLVDVSGSPPRPGATLLVLPNGTEQCCQISSDLLGELTSIGFQKNYTVIDRENLDRILEEQKMQLSGIVNSEFAIEAGQLTGAQNVVISQCYCNNQDALYSVKIINCETSEVQATALFTLDSPLKLGNRIESLFQD